MEYHVESVFKKLYPCFLSFEWEKDMKQKSICDIVVNLKANVESIVWYQKFSREFL